MDELSCMNIMFSIAILFTQVKFSLASISDLNNEQIFNSSDLPEDVEVFSHYKFKILKQPTRCSHRSLEKCHISEEMYYSYYDNCYSDACSKMEYYCRNNPHGSTVHICGKSDECQKRRRNIAVRDSVDLDSVHVYSVACPVGYFQPNKKICFDSCKKDISIVVNDAVEHKSVVARCKSEEGYCNAKHVTYFRIGSGNDTCVLAFMDLKIRCGEGKELMPDCSCAEACQVNEERDWSESLRCISKQSSSSIMVADNTTKATVKGVTYRDGDNSSQPMHSQTKSKITYHYQQTSDTTDNWRDTSKENTDSIHSSPLVLILVIALFVSLVVALAIIALVIWKFLSKSQGDDHIASQDQRIPGIEKSKIKKKNNGTVLQVGNKAKNININHLGYEKLPTLSYSDKVNIDAFSDKNDMSPPENANTQTLMKNLKLSYVQEDDSGVRTIEDTAMKNKH